MKFAILNTVTKAYIAVEKTEYIYTKLPGNIQKFDTDFEAIDFLQNIVNHVDFRLDERHEIVEVA